MLVNVGGVEALSTVDYPEHACMTIFLRGCERRCSFCHNKHLQCGETYVDIDLVFHAIDEATPFISAVICSGGEPLLQIEAVKEIATYAHNRGLKFGVHTASEDKLPEVKGYIDYAYISNPNVHPNKPGSHHAIWYDHGGREYIKDTIKPPEKIGKFAE